MINSVALNSTYRFAGTDSIGGFYIRSVVDGTTGWTVGLGLPGAPSVVSSVVPNKFNMSTLFLGTEGVGVFRSSNSGFNWSATNSGMMGVAARKVKRNLNGNIILGGDFGDGIWISTDQGTSWKQSSIPTANAITGIVVTNTASVLYAGAYGSGVYKST